MHGSGPIDKALHTLLCVCVLALARCGEREERVCKVHMYMHVCVLSAERGKNGPKYGSIFNH